MCKYYMQFWKAVLFYIITCEENLEGDASIHSWLKNNQNKTKPTVKMIEVSGTSLANLDAI